MARLTAVVLAGGPPDDVSRTEPGAPNKAFVRIAGRALVERVLSALRAARSIDRIRVVAPVSTHGSPVLALADEFRADGIRITHSLRNGLDALPPDDVALVVASDLPVLTPQCVDDFAERAATCGADAAYGCVARTVHVAKYPHVRHTWARMREGTFCGGGIMALRPRVLPSLERFLEQLGAARKKPWRLARVFGIAVLVKYATGQLTIADAETRASLLLQAPVRAIVSPYAETAINVDGAEDISVAERLIAGSASA